MDKKGDYDVLTENQYKKKHEFIKSFFVNEVKIKKEEKKI